MTFNSLKAKDYSGEFVRLKKMDIMKKSLFG